MGDCVHVLAASTPTVGRDRSLAAVLARPALLRKVLSGECGDLAVELGIDRHARAFGLFS
jgi:hypothetical protein